ncbi:nuclear fragile X mental retardation protein interacting protein 1 [Sparganum proliferum]
MSEKDQLPVSESDQHSLHEATAATTQTFLQTPPEQLFFNSSALAWSVPRRRSGLENAAFCPLTTSPTSAEAGQHVVHSVGSSLLEKSTKKAVAKITTCGSPTHYYSMGHQKVGELLKNTSPTEDHTTDLRLNLPDESVAKGLLYCREKEEENCMPKQSTSCAEEVETSTPSLEVTGEGIIAADVEPREQEEGSGLAETYEQLPSIPGSDATMPLYDHVIAERERSLSRQATVPLDEEQCGAQSPDVSEYYLKTGIGDWDQQFQHEDVKKDKEAQLPTSDPTFLEQEPTDCQCTDASSVGAEISSGQSSDTPSERSSKDGPSGHQPTVPAIRLPSVNLSVVQDSDVDPTTAPHSAFDDVTHLKVPDVSHPRGRRGVNNLPSETRDKFFFPIEGLFSAEEGDMDSVGLLDEFSVTAAVPVTSLESHLGGNERSDEHRVEVTHSPPLGSNEGTTEILAACCSHKEKQLVASCGSTSTYRLPTTTLQTFHQSLQHRPQVNERHSDDTQTGKEEEEDEQTLRSLYLIVPQIAPGELESVSFFPLSDRAGDSAGSRAVVHVVSEPSNLCVCPQPCLQWPQKARLESMESLGLMDPLFAHAQGQWNLQLVTLHRLRTLCLSSLLWISGRLMQTSRGILASWMARLFPSLSQNSVGYENPVDRNSSNATTIRDGMLPSARLLEVRRKWRPQVNDNYYSDGICGVTFGIERPEFCHPLKTCCDHHFFTEEEFRRHEAQHIKCPHEECPVVIHPSVLNFHIETAHSPEVFARLNPVLADKSIVSWRDSRKKNYPTFERVQAKIRETGYRIQRGQVLLTKQFGSLNKRKPFELRDPNSTRVDKPKGPNPRPQDATSRRHGPRNTLQPPLEAVLPHAASSTATPPEAQSPQNDNPSSSSPLPPPPPPPSSPEKSDSDMEEADSDPVPAVVTSTATTNMPVGCLVAYDYDSDLSWDETLPTAAAAAATTTTAAPLTEEPKVAVDSSQTLEPEQSTPATTSLLDQLSSLKPKFSGAESQAEQKESPGSPVTVNPTPAAATGRARPPPNRLRRGRRQRGQNRGGRPRRGGDDSQSEGREDRGRRRRRGGRATTETNVEEEKEEEDEEGASGVTAIFASHPVVRMASKRRECMRNAALMAKRPTLLQMLLAEEMRHERNQLMQCVRFVVRNNFFR